MGEKERRLYYGPYLGVVIDNVDELGIQRIRATCEAVYGIDDEGGAVVSDWALPRGLPDDVVPDVGALVWLTFQGGDPDYPIWEWGPKSAPDGLQNTSSSFRGVASRSEAVVESSAEMPATNFDPDPSQVWVKEWGGHKIEMDKTSGKERLRIFHSAGGFIEFDPGGGMRQRSKGNCFVSVRGNLAETVGLNRTTIIKGSKYEEVNRGEKKLNTGDFEQVVLGNTILNCQKYQLTTGDYILLVQGDESEQVIGNKSISVGGGFNLGVNNSIGMTAFELIEMMALAANPLREDVALPGVRPIPFTAKPGIDYKAVNSWARFAAETTPGVVSAELLLDSAGLLGMSELFSLGALGLFSPVVAISGGLFAPTSIIVDNLLGTITAIAQSALSLTANGIMTLTGNVNLGLFSSTSVQLGGLTAVSPVVKGTEWASVMSALATLLGTIDAGGATGANLAAITAWAVTHVTALSPKVFTE